MRELKRILDVTFNTLMRQVFPCNLNELNRK